MHFGQPVLKKKGQAFVQSMGWAGRRIGGKRFVGLGRELADSAVASQVCLAPNEVNGAL
jgi:hypothetical protein